MKYNEITYWGALIGVWFGISYSSVQLTIGFYKITRNIYLKFNSKKLE